MAGSTLLNLNGSMAPKLIRILYCIALVLIVLGTLRGVVGGVVTMTRPAPQMAAAAPADQNAAPTAQAPQNTQPGGMNRPDFGPRRFRRGPGFGGRRGPMMMGGLLRGMPPAVVGGLRILLALLRGFIVLLVVRVLAEIGLAVLAMGTRPDASRMPAL
jgi:hypothetical protein